jgi:hypothetical protein
MFPLACHDDHDPFLARRRRQNSKAFTETPKPLKAWHRERGPGQVSKRKALVCGSFDLRPKKVLGMNWGCSCCRESRGSWNTNKPMMWRSLEAWDLLQMLLSDEIEKDAMTLLRAFGWMCRTMEIMQWQIGVIRIFEMRC